MSNNLKQILRYKPILWFISLFENTPLYLNNWKWYRELKGGRWEKWYIESCRSDIWLEWDSSKSRKISLGNLSYYTGSPHYSRGNVISVEDYRRIDKIDSIL